MNKKPIAIIEQDREKRQKKVFSLLKKEKGQILILVPEVSMLDSWKEYGVLYYAGLRVSEKKDIWNSVYEGDTHIVIGTQKALFLPFRNLTAIVVDEEQYDTYKLWDQYPRLHTVRGALELSKIAGARMIYSSSYPSIALRYAIQEKECEVKTNAPIEIHAEVVSYSFEDRKWKRPLPSAAGSSIRMWARGEKKVLVLYNKKDNQKLKESLSYRLSKKAKAHIFLGTTALLTDAKEGFYDRVVWIAPEYTFRATDHRSFERARILAARLQGLTPKHPLLLATRLPDLVNHIFTTSDNKWYETVLTERRLLGLPPLRDLVRLTVRDTDQKKARKRADELYDLLEKSFEGNTKMRVFGPFQERSPEKRRKEIEYHILISGALDDAIASYKNLPIDAADVDPHRIV